MCHFFSLSIFTLKLPLRFFSFIEDEEDESKDGTETQVHRRN